MTIYAGENKRIEELRELLSSKPNGNQYEILGNTPKRTSTDLVKLYNGRREHRIIKSWTSNWYAWLEMSEPDWTPDKVFEELSKPLPLEEPSSLTGSNIKSVIETDIECIAQLLHNKNVTGYIPERILLKALNDAQQDWAYLNKRVL